MFLPKTSSSFLSLAFSILSGVGVNLSPFERSEFSDTASSFCDKLKKITNKFSLHSVILLIQPCYHKCPAQHLNHY